LTRWISKKCNPGIQSEQPDKSQDTCDPNLQRTISDPHAVDASSVLPLESASDKGKGNTAADPVVVVDAPVDVSGTTCRVIQSEQTSIELDSTPDSRPKSSADVIAVSHALQTILHAVNGSHNVSANGIAVDFCCTSML
jgi:hypothetical protein